MKKFICSILIVLVIVISFPVSAFSSDFGLFCSDDVVYSTDSIPSFQNLVSGYKYRFLIYNSLDSCFYYCAVQEKINSIFVNSSDVFSLNVYNSNVLVYKYDSSNSNAWVNIVNRTCSYTSYTYTAFSCSKNFKIKFLYTNSDFIYSDNNYNYTITSDDSDLDDYDIYANFFDPSGVYLANDPAIEDNSSDEPSGTVTVDMTGTNNRLDSIKSVVDDVADDVSTIKSNFTTLLTDIGVIKTSTSSAASDVGTIKSDLSTSKGYIDTIKSDITALKTAFNTFVSSDVSAIKSGISSINSDLNTKLTAVITALGDVQTAVAAVPTGINSRLDTVNQNLVYIYQALVKQYTGLNDYSTVYQEFVVTQGRLETIAYKIEAFQDLFGNFAGTVFSPFIDPEEEKLSIYENMVAAFSDKFEMLYNVILYGDKNGAEAQQLEQMKMKQFQADLDSITARLDDAPSAINSNAADVSAEISVFTQFYEGITALNAALSSVLYFGLILIFIKKVVGR